MIFYGQSERPDPIPPVSPNGDYPFYMPESLVCYWLTIKVKLNNEKSRNNKPILGLKFSLSFNYKQHSEQKTCNCRCTITTIHHMGIQFSFIIIPFF